VGYKAEYYKIVYINGVEKDRIKLNSSYYQAAPKYITVGDKEEVTATPAPTDAATSATDVKEEDTPSVVNPQGTTTRPGTTTSGTRPNATNTGTTAVRPNNTTSVRPNTSTNSTTATRPNTSTNTTTAVRPAN
jgi:hypothetical protein